MLNEEIETIGFIDKSRVVIFIVTNDYLKQNKFKLEYKRSIELKKIILIILLEEIVNIAADNLNEPELELNKFNVINFAKNICNEVENLWYGEPFHKLCYCIQYIFGKKLFEDHHINITAEYLSNAVVKSDNISQIASWQPIKSYDYSIDDQSLFKNYSNSYFINTDKHLIEYKCRTILFYDKNTMNLIKIKKLDFLETNSLRILKGCYIDHLNYICIVCNSEVAHDDDRKFIFLIDLNTLDKVKEIDIIGNVSCAYNEYNQLIYILIQNTSTLTMDIYDSNLEFLDSHILQKNTVDYFNSLRIINNFVYLLNGTIVYVTDSDMQYITYFDFDQLNMTNSFLKTDNSNYILIDGGGTIFAFDSNNYEYLGKFDAGQSNVVYKNIRMSSLYQDEDIYIYGFNIEYDYMNYMIDNLFVCKFNKFNYHSMREPYSLPCHRIACLRCICENYNFKVNKLSCNFCRELHEIKICRNNFIVELFSQNIYETAFKQIKYSRKYFDLLGE